MNRTILVLIGGILLSIYAGLNYYIGLRGWQSLVRLLPQYCHRLYWGGFWLWALSYLGGRLTKNLLPSPITAWLTVAGSYWLGAMYYFLLFILGIDIIRGVVYLTGKITGRWPTGFNNQYVATGLGLAVLAAVTCIVVYGAWNARNPIVTRYEITIPKQAGKTTSLHAVLVSDIHLGRIVDNGRLNAMADLINGIKPDIILMPGDIIDEDIGSFVEQRMRDTFLRMRSKYGIYASPGNHEQYAGKANEMLHYMQEAGINVLKDDWVKVADSFYIVGRNDPASEHMSRVKDGLANRADLTEVLEGIDHSLPVILLDHQPSRIDQAAKNNVDLQLSGHTHRGQLFPNNFITSRIFEADWGLLKKDQLQVIVTSGFGTWGPPIRVGNKPEVVEIFIRFGGGSVKS